MKLLGTLNVFVEDKQTKEGETFKAFRASISSPVEKDEAGNVTKFARKSLDVYFVGENFKKESLTKMESTKMYKVEVEDGFLGARDREVTIEDEVSIRHEATIIITKAHVVEVKDIQKPVEKPVEKPAPKKTAKKVTAPKDSELPF